MNGSIYDKGMYLLERFRLLKERKYLISRSRGKILEIGAGTGINFPLYNGKDVVAIDPDEEMLKVARKRKKDNIKILNMSGESLNFEEDRFDTVIITLSLCTVDDPKKTLVEVKRVLKKGGKLLILEHIKSENKGFYKFQKRLEPRWKVFACGCRLTRDTVKIVEDMGFKRISLKYFIFNIFIRGEYIN